MGSYVYTQRKKTLTCKIRGTEETITVGVYRFAFKPYWNIFDYLERDNVPMHFGSWEKSVLKMYRRYCTRANNLPDHKFIIFEYEGADGKYSTDGKVFYKSGWRNWVVDDYFAVPSNLVGNIYGDFVPNENYEKIVNGGK